MTSETRERSWSDGVPVALFRFTRGARSWFYSSSDRAELHNGDTYEPAPISYGSIKQGSERSKLSVKIELPATLPVAANWRPYPPSDAVVLTIFNRHVGETDALVEWMGRVVGPEFDGPLLELTGEPSTTSNRRKGNTRTWQRGCGHVLYGIGNGLCNVDKAAHAVAASLTAVTGLSLTAAAFGALPAGRLAGGFVEWARVDGLVEFRTIKSHAGSTITLDYGGLDLAVGLAVTAYPGCAHNWADCGYYSNQPNYGGDLWMPIKGPYDGNPVW